MKKILLLFTVITLAFIGCHTDNKVPDISFATKSPVELAASEKPTVWFANNWQELQDGYTAAASYNIGLIEITAAEIDGTGKIIDMPKKLKVKSLRLKTVGNNCNFITDSTAIRRAPVDQTEANNVMQSQAFDFEDITFTGKGKGIAIDLGCTYGSVIQRCNFNNINAGVWTRFALMTTVRNCFATNPRTYGFVLDMGNWPGASNSNSQSNHSRIEQCRVFCYQGMTAAYAVIAASGCVLDQDIAEGKNPINNILVDAKNSTVVKETTIRTFHGENTPTGSHIKFIVPDGIHTVDNSFTQYKSIFVEVVSTRGYPHIQVSNIAYLPGGCTFKGTPQTAWIFTEMPMSWDVTNPANWTGPVPTSYYSFRMNQSPIIQASSLTINGKKPVLQ